MSKKSGCIIGLATTLGIFLMAQSQGGWGSGIRSKCLDDNTPFAFRQIKKTIRGEIVQVNRNRLRNEVSDDILCFTIKTVEGFMKVHLAPAWYLRELKLDLKKADVIQVTGVQTVNHIAPAIMANKILRKGKVFNFQNENGTSLWKGRLNQL